MKTLRFTELLFVIPILIIGSAISPIATQAQSWSPPSKLEVASAMGRVNDHWISRHPDPGDNKWAQAVYYFGDMAHYMTTGEANYLDHATDWAEQHSWLLNGGCNTAHADNQAAGRTYLALYDLEPVPEKILCITTSIDHVVDRYLNHETLDDWWWIDAMFMAMPIYAKLSVGNGNYNYSEAMYALYRDTKVSRGLYNADAGLWYRDENYKPPNASPNGKDIFWSRGNGWVFAAHADVLATLSPDDLHYIEYLTTFKEMAAALKAVQRSDGFWNVNLADPDDYPGPETSGTAFFTYGMAIGIEMGILSPAEYLEPVVRAWNGMITAVHPNGKLGFVQGVGKAPSSAQSVTYDSTADFGVGAFLLAGKAVHKIAEVSGPTNLALNKAATCSSEPQLENGCAHTVDGDMDDRWSATGFPQWVEVDLGDVYRISGVNVHPYKDRAYQYYVEVRTAVEDPYVPLVDRSGNTQGGAVIMDTFSAVSARYVRLRVESAYDYTGPWVSIRELEILGSATPPPANLALNQAVTCSSEPQPENGCAHTVDGDVDDRWSAIDFPQWVEVDLGDVYHVSGVNVHPYKDRAYQYYVEVKTAVEDPYVPLVDRSGNTQGGSVIKDTFSAVPARYVRLRVESAYDYTGRWVSIRELEILGSATPPPTNLALNQAVTCSSEPVCGELLLRRLPATGIDRGNGSSTGTS
ncbi:MAG: glycoside hydrolase family 88 protein [Gammaproteobacteria bacterium]|nr:glycoside hydrolase family 88 protein [Gammaproteobacteria bacterium]